MLKSKKKNKPEETVIPETYAGVGAELRAVREGEGLTIAEVAANLNLASATIEAIESGQFDKLPGHAYAIGFIQAYAIFLGVDEKQAVDLYKQEAKGINDNRRMDFPQPLDESRRPRRGFIFLLLFVVAVSYGTWVFFKRQTQVASQVPEPPAAMLTTPETGQLAEEPKAPVSDGAASSEMAASQTPPVADGASQDAVSTDATPSPESAQSEVSTAAPARPAASQPDAIGEAVIPSTTDAAAGTGNGPEAVTPENSPVNSPAEREAVNAMVSEDARAENMETKTEAVTAAEPQSTQAATAGQAPAEPAMDARPAAVESETAAPAGGEVPVESAQSAAEEKQPVTQPAASDGATAAQETVKQESETVQSDAVRSAPPLAQRQFAGTGGQMKVAKTQVYGAGNRDARIIVKATEDAWVQVRGKNNELLLTRMLHAGDSYHAPNRDDLKLTTGNAGAIEVSLDGQALGRLGDIGQVMRDVALSPDQIKSYFSQ